MNPIFISTFMKIIQGLKRVCPKCERPQFVSSDRKNSVVCCKFCGTDIPPKKITR